MMTYRFGITQLLTKVNILKDEFTHINLYSPIEHVTSRLKTPESIIRKANRIGCPLTLDDVREQILDIAGVRITCSFIADTYRIADMITSQPDIEVREVEDYIAKPKPNGYKSLHLIVEVPVYLSDRVQQVPIELQIRTIARISGPASSTRSTTSSIARCRRNCSPNSPRPRRPHTGWT